jgi:UvrD-like helicase C-terminal domain/AAA domain
VRSAMVTSREAVASHELLLARLAQSIPAGALAVCADDTDRPDLVVVDPARGLVVIDIAPTAYDPADRDPMRTLNRKVNDLRAAVPIVGDFRPQRLVVFGGNPGSLIQSGALGLADLERSDWLDQLEVRKLASADLEVLRSALAPTLAFTLRARRGIGDHGRLERREQQLLLDAQQAVAATVPVDDVLVLSGPPGSGKTLVLAGRAKYLAAEHPDWHIVILCYNNSLVPYLKSLVDGYPNVAVSTFGKFSHAMGHRISLNDSERAMEDLVRARARGIDRLIDALLIDEAQDFDDAWLGFVLDTLRPGRGGALLAGDERQALYRDPSRPWALEGRRVAHLRLERTYRSTRQILEAASTTVQGRYDVDGEGALAGELVDLIWAQSWDEQATAIAWEVSRMIGPGKRQPQDLAVLVTQRSGTFKRIQAALDRVNVPYLVVTRENAATFDLGSPEVKIMTVHAAKGYEFDVVVLFGLEALPSPTEDAEAAQRASVGFVGMTRARDQLLVTYTRDNPYLERLRQCRSVNFSVWPDDYEV